MIKKEESKQIIQVVHNQFPKETGTSCPSLHSTQDPPAAHLQITTGGGINGESQEEDILHNILVWVPVAPEAQEGSEQEVTPLELYMCSMWAV